MIEFFDYCRTSGSDISYDSVVKKVLLDATKMVIQRKLREGFTIYAIGACYAYNKKGKYWEVYTRAVLNGYPSAGLVPDYDLVRVENIGDIALNVV